MNEKFCNGHTLKDLKYLKQLDLNEKILITNNNILEWYANWDGKCYVSISGKDSTVLAHLCGKICELFGYKLILWYSDTGLEFPEVKQHVNNYSKWLEQNLNCEVEFIYDYPKDRYERRITFKNVIDKFGYPLISKEVSQKIYEARKNPNGKVAERFKPNNKYGNYSMEKWNWLKDSSIPISHKCCEKMKKEPAKKFERRTGLKPFVGTTTDESMLRKTNWIRNGCNSYGVKRQISMPIAFWSDSDIWEYIKRYKLPYPSIYGEIVCNEYNKTKVYSCTGEQHTGCIWCMFGVHLENEPNKFQRLKITHPQIYEYCMKPWNEGGIGLKKILEFIGVNIN